MTDQITYPTADAIAAVPDEAVTAAVRLLDECVTGHRSEVANELGGLDVDACPHPISIETDARAIAAAVEPHYTIAAHEATATAIEQFAARMRRAGRRRDAAGIEEAAELVRDQVRVLRARLDALSTTTQPTKE